MILPTLCLPLIAWTPSWMSRALVFVARSAELNLYNA